jgi:hypothetical protein
MDWPDSEGERAIQETERGAAAAMAIVTEATRTIDGDGGPISSRRPKAGRSWAVDVVGVLQIRSDTSPTAASLRMVGGRRRLSTIGNEAEGKEKGSLAEAEAEVEWEPGWRWGAEVEVESGGNDTKNAASGRKSRAIGRYLPTSL